MIKEIVIDGNNLLHSIPSFKHIKNKENEDVRLTLAEWVKSRTGAGKVKIFFDGYGTDKNNIIYSRGKTADELIRKYIENHKTPVSLKIISSDKGITNLAKVCGCLVQSSKSFYDEAGRNPTKDKNINQLFIYGDEKPGGMSKKDLNEFQKYFT